MFTICEHIVCVVSVVSWPSQMSAGASCFAYDACMACCSEATNGAEVVARMLEHIARHKGYIPIPEPPEGDIGTANGYNANGPPRGRAVARAGAGRLRDAIVFGYMMQRHRARGKVCKVFTCQELSFSLQGKEEKTRKGRNRIEISIQVQEHKTKTALNRNARQKQPTVITGQDHSTRKIHWRFWEIQEGLPLIGV